MSPADVAMLAVVSWSGTLLLAHDGIPIAAARRLSSGGSPCAAGFLALLGLVQVLTGQAWVDRLSIPGLTAAEATG